MSRRVGSGRVGSDLVGLLVFCLRLNSDLIFLCCTYFLKKAPRCWLLCYLPLKIRGRIKMCFFFQFVLEI